MHTLHRTTGVVSVPQECTLIIGDEGRGLARDALASLAEKEVVLCYGILLRKNFKKKDAGRVLPPRIRFCVRKRGRFFSRAQYIGSPHSPHPRAQCTELLQIAGVPRGDTRGDSRGDSWLVGYRRVGDS